MKNFAGEGGYSVVVQYCASEECSLDLEHSMAEHRKTSDEECSQGKGGHRIEDKEGLEGPPDEKMDEGMEGYPNEEG